MDCRPALGRSGAAPGPVRDDPAARRPGLARPATAAVPSRGRVHRTSPPRSASQFSQGPCLGVIADTAGGIFLKIFAEISQKGFI